MWSVMGASTLGQHYLWFLMEMVGNCSPWRIGHPMHCHCLCQYTLTSVMSPSAISLLLLCFETLGNRCAQFKSPSLLSHFPLICHGFDIKIFHQRIQTTHSHTSHCNHCHYCKVDCYIILSHATLILYYHTSMLTLLTSLLSHALWLPHVWYWGGWNVFLSSMFNPQMLERQYLVPYLRGRSPTCVANPCQGWNVFPRFLGKFLTHVTLSILKTMRLTIVISKISTLTCIYHWYFRENTWNNYTSFIRSSLSSSSWT